MTRKLRILQVGAGARAQSHLAAMRTTDTVEIVGLCELDPTRLATTADTFGITARYSDMATAIAATQPDLVDIVTPPQIRLSIVQQAVDAGAPAILIEKPIALTPSESRALAALGEQRLIAVNTQYQWMPHWQQIWGLLRAGHIGDIWAIRASTRVNILEQGPHILDGSQRRPRQRLTCATVGAGKLHRCGALRYHASTRRHQCRDWARACPPVVQRGVIGARSAPRNRALLPAAGGYIGHHGAHLGVTQPGLAHVG